MKRSWTIKANNLYYVLISHRLECHCCHVGDIQIFVFSTYPVFRTQYPLSLSLSTPTTNSAARVPINLLPPPAPCQLRGCHEHTDIFPRAPPPPLGVVSVLFLARRVRPLQTSIDLFRRKYWSAAGRGCPWPPWIVSWHERRGISVTHYITETDYLTTAKSFVFPSLLTRSTKPTQSTVSPLLSQGLFWPFPR